jgi:tRNA (cytidine56-2'-O)-methyltransferase
MHELPDVAVLRLGHRPGRDERMTTHIGLTARALGADRVWIEPAARSTSDTVRDVTERFGGPFEIEVTESPKRVLREWPGSIVHLTMYGLSVTEVEAEIRATHRENDDPLLVVVGAEKVPFSVYERADWNLGVTNQPHSEVAALAVFLDRLFEGREFDREWQDASRRVVPEALGKTVEPVDPSDSTGE